MRKYLLLLSLFFPFIVLGAIVPYSQDWENTVTLSNWVSSGGSVVNLTSDAPCNGSNSVRARLSGTGDISQAILTSPNLGNNEGAQITFSYSYKWLVDNGNVIGNPMAAPANSLDLKWQWSNTVSGPWYTFETKGSSTHTPSNSCGVITSTFYAYGGKPLYVRVVVNNLNPNSSNFIYIDDVNIEEDNSILPTCGLPNNVRIVGKSSTGFDFIRWNAPSVGTPVDYEWEVRTSGEPGTQTGRVAGGTTTTTQTPVTGLAPSTTYKVYVRVICNNNDPGPWIGIDATTHCDWPAFNPTQVYNLCGIQNLRIQGGNMGSKYWFDEDGNFIQSSNDFNIPNVSESVNLKVFAGTSTATSNREITIGTGIGANTVGVPFPETKGSKVQYIYQAQELRSAGFSGGIIKSFGFRVGTVPGTLDRSNFAIYIGETQMDQYGTNDFIPTTDLKLVKNQGKYKITTNAVNMFELDDPFIWDGVSNIVVQFTYDEDVAKNVSATNAISSNFTGSNRTIYTTSGSLDFNALNGVGTGTRTEIRINGYFDILEGCFGPMKTINVNYTEAPDLILSSNRANNCSGKALDKIYVLSGGNIYDTYEWTPEDVNNPNDPNNASNAIVGDAVNGWTFNPTTNMTYTLKASSSTGQRCVITQTVSVEFNESPQLLPLQTDYILCNDDIQEIKVLDFVDEHPIKYNFNNGISGVTLNNSAIGDAISHETIVKSEGSGSLKIVHGAQSDLSVVFDTALNTKNTHNIIVEFDHLAALQSNSTSVFDFAYLEYSTDNGTTWNPFVVADYIGQANTSLPRPIGNTSLQAMFFTSRSYIEWANIDQNTDLTTVPWKTEKFIVPASALTNGGIFKLRLKVGSDGNTLLHGWFVDNVKITPISKYNVEWSTLNNLYYDQNATVPFDGKTNVGVLYLKGSNILSNVPYYVTVENISGCKEEKKFNVSVGSKELPIVHDIDSCGPVDINNLNFGKNAIGRLYFYNSTTSINPITSITTSGIYFVEQEIGGCKSVRVPFNVVINAKAVVPMASANQAFCGATTIDDLNYNSVPGLQIRWYLTSVGGSPILTGTPINNGIYYAEFTNGTCLSETRTPVNVTVGIIPASLSIADVYICGNSIISDINIKATNNAVINWYQNLADSTPLSNNTVLTNGTYYVAQKVGNCESTRTPVNVSVVPNLPLPNANTIQVFCGSATVQDLMASGTTTGVELNWYSFSTSDSPLSKSTPLTSGTYYVGQAIGDCHSPKRAVSVRIISTTPPVINAISVCGDSTVASIPLNSSSTISYKIYTTMWSTTEMGQNDVITTGVYYISRVENGCESLKTPVQITVYNRPNSPTGNNIQTFQDYAEVRELATNESNVVWFESYNDAVNNVNPLFSSTPLQNDRKYYGVIVGAGNCASLPFEVTVKITLGVNELDLASLRYYPNPVDNEINVSYKEAITGLEVYDLSGKLVRKQSFEANDVKLETSGLSAGTYMIKVLTNNGSQFIKVVKK